MITQNHSFEYDFTRSIGSGTSNMGKIAIMGYWVNGTSDSQQIVAGHECRSQWNLEHMELDILATFYMFSINNPKLKRAMLKQYAQSLMSIFDVRIGFLC